MVMCIQKFKSCWISKKHIFSSNSCGFKNQDLHNSSYQTIPNEFLLKISFEIYGLMILRCLKFHCRVHILMILNNIF